MNASIIQASVINRRPRYTRRITMLQLLIAVACVGIPATVLFPTVAKPVVENSVATGTALDQRVMYSVREVKTFVRVTVARIKPSQSKFRVVSVRDANLSNAARS
jgi:Tfp pilus assembly major pilin PilA